MAGWDPFREFESFERRVNRLFENLTTPRAATSEEPWAPPVDVIETDEWLIVQLDAPGMRRDAIAVTLEADTLTISGERMAPDHPQRVLRCERPTGPFRRSFQIGVPIDTARVRATYRDGVLEVMLPKAVATEPHTVQVEVSGTD